MYFCKPSCRVAAMQVNALTRRYAAFAASCLTLMADHDSDDSELSSCRGTAMFARPQSPMPSVLGCCGMGTGEDQAWQGCPVGWPASSLLLSSCCCFLPHFLKYTGRPVGMIYVRRA